MTKTFPSSKKSKRPHRKSKIRHSPLRDLLVEIAVKNNSAQIKIATEAELIGRQIKELSDIAHETNSLRLDKLAIRLRHSVLELEKTFEMLKPSMSSGRVEKLCYSGVYAKSGISYSWPKNA